MRKSTILASQTLPKTFPKSFQNRGSKKHTIFHRFLVNFCYLLQAPTSKIHRPSQCFVSFSHISVFRFSHTFFLQKTYQKPFQNEVRTLPKSMPKTCCFLTSFFSGFGLDFGGSWTSMLEPSWFLKPQKTISVAHFYLLKLNVFKQLRLRGLWPRFWRPRGSILEGPGSIF